MANKCFANFAPSSFTHTDGSPDLGLVAFGYIVLGSDGALSTQAGDSVGVQVVELALNDTVSSLRAKFQDVIAGLGYTNVTYVYLDSVGIL